MNTIQLYIEENLNSEALEKLKTLLMQIEHVVDVELSSKFPHELVIEYEENYDMPINIIEILKAEGYHQDIFSG